MSTINNGEDSAFPRPVSWSEEGGTHRGTLGMTLLDYFAGQALAGICASSPSDDCTDKYIAEESYRLANAMIKARKAKP
jgi:hypothetical protein